MQYRWHVLFWLFFGLFAFAVYGLYTGVFTSLNSFLIMGLILTLIGQRTREC